VGKLVAKRLCLRHSETGASLTMRNWDFFWGFIFGILDIQNSVFFVFWAISSM
jgi:hypothetical protein